MGTLAQSVHYSTAAYNAYKLTNAWVQVVVYVLLTVSIVGTLGAALYCISRGGSLEWIWQFGIFIKLACKFNR